MYSRRIKATARRLLLLGIIGLRLLIRCPVHRYQELPCSHDFSNPYILTNTMVFPSGVQIAMLTFGERSIVSCQKRLSGQEKPDIDCTPFVNIYMLG